RSGRLLGQGSGRALGGAGPAVTERARRARPRIRRGAETPRGSGHGRGGRPEGWYASGGLGAIACGATIRSTRGSNEHENRDHRDGGHWSMSVTSCPALVKNPPTTHPMAPVPMIPILGTGAIGCV